MAIAGVVVSSPAQAAGLTLTAVVRGMPIGGGPAETVYGADVTIFDSAGEWLGSKATNTTGVVEFSGLPAGGYKIRVLYPDWPNPADTLGWGGAWYGGTPFAADAAVFELSADSTVEFELQRGASISGRVLNTANQGLEDSWIWVYLVHPVTGDLELLSGTDPNGMGEYTVGHLPAGDYVIEFLDSRQPIPGYADQYWQGQARIEDASPVTVAPGDALTGYDAVMTGWEMNGRRLAGSDRFLTAVRISEDTFPLGAEVVFLANGLNFPDALAAGPAAAKLGGPVLLTTPDALLPPVAAEIDRLSPDRVVIVGGPSSVSNAVRAAVEDLGIEVDRVAGADRFETSRLVADYAFDESRFVFIATGNGFPDALSAGAAAAYYDAPLILLNGSASTTDAPTRAVIDELGVEAAWLVGGPPSLSTGIRDALFAQLGEANQLAGVDRYDTSAKVLQSIFVTSSREIYLATGSNFPDALAGAAAAGAKGAPLAITLKTCMPYESWFQLKRLRVYEPILLGSSASIAGDVWWQC